MQVSIVGEAKRVWGEAIKKYPKNIYTKVVLEFLNSLDAKIEDEPK